MKNLERKILGFAGISPVNETLIGMVNKRGDDGARKWQDTLRQARG